MVGANDIVVVIGMARSGTALACQVLEALGVSFGDPDHLVGPTNFNTRGHYDYGPVHSLNVDLLARLFKISWLFLGELPRGWHAWESVGEFKDEAKRLISEGYEFAQKRGCAFALKDPRITRMREFWEGVFSSLGLTPHYILSWRHPHHVYLSCHPRILNDAGASSSERVEEYQAFETPSCPNIFRQDFYAIWAHYMAAGFEANPDVVVKYDNWFLPGWGMKQMTDLASLVGTEPLTGESLGSIIDPEMRHYGN